MIRWILLAVMTISDAGSDVLLSHGTKQVAQASDLRRWDILGIVARAIQNVESGGCRHPRSHSFRSFCRAALVLGPEPSHSYGRA